MSFAPEPELEVMIPEFILDRAIDILVAGKIKHTVAKPDELACIILILKDRLSVARSEAEKAVRALLNKEDQ